MTEALQEQGLRAPMLFRFLPIVGHRIDKINVSWLDGAVSVPLAVQLGAGQGGWIGSVLAAAVD